MSEQPIDDLPLLNPADFPDCLVCGPANPEGLGLRIHRDGTDAVARYTPRATQIGYPERVHGGLIGMLVDEMLVYAGAPHDLWGMTAKVRYWLRRPIPVGQELTLRSRLVQRSERGFRSVVTIHLPDGSLAAEGGGDVRHPQRPHAVGRPRSWSRWWLPMVRACRRAASPPTTSHASSARLSAAPRA